MMSQKFFYWGALAIAIVANISANTALKKTMTSVSGSSGKELVLHVLTQASFWIATIFLGILLISYLAALRSVPVSVAYVAVTSFALVGLVIVERFYLGAPLGVTKLFGVALVVSGVVLMAKGS